MKPGADCGSDPEILIAKFRLILKKVGKTTRPFRYEASLITQLVKNLPGMQETPVQFLGWEEPLEKGKATHSNVLAWRIPWTV